MIDGLSIQLWEPSNMISSGKYGLIPWISCENIWAMRYNVRKMLLPRVIKMNFVFRYHCIKTKRTKKKEYGKMNNLEIFIHRLDVAVQVLRTNIKINVWKPIRRLTFLSFDQKSHYGKRSPFRR